MVRKFKSLALILFFISGLHNFGHSQSLYNVMANNTIDIKLSGTSTLHDWEMDSHSTSGRAEFVLSSDDSNDLLSIQSLSFSLLVNNLTSESNAMDKNAYKALKSDVHKNINYNLTSSTLSPQNGGYLIKSIGNLTIAGVTKEIIMDVHSTMNEDSTIACRGSYALKMTDYNVTPPSFMWGAMKTGDDITLDFVVVYKKK